MCAVMDQKGGVANVILEFGPAAASIIIIVHHTVKTGLESTAACNSVLNFGDYGILVATEP